jgi:hypothetical protein
VADPLVDIAEHAPGERVHVGNGGALALSVEGNELLHVADAGPLLVIEVVVAEGVVQLVHAGVEPVELEESLLCKRVYSLSCRPRLVEDLHLFDRRVVNLRLFGEREPLLVEAERQHKPSAEVQHPLSSLKQCLRIMIALEGECALGERAP